MARFVAPALRALLGNLIDYAGIFPPASLSLESAIANYDRYRNGENGWMLGRFVIPADQLDKLPASVDYPFSVLSESDHARAAAIESKKIIATSKPSYCEVSLDQLDQVKKAGCFAKIRTGGITPESIPAVDRVAAYINACANRRLPFKATAGLHHPIRSVYPLTYEVGAPTAKLHGFINLFLAAVFAWHGEPQIDAILAEEDPAVFRFDDLAHWRDRSLQADQIAEARRDFAHSFGSCSFEEPVEDLRQLQLL